MKENAENATRTLPTRKERSKSLYDTTFWSSYSTKNMFNMFARYDQLVVGFQERFCLWLRRGVFGSNPSSGCVRDFQCRILVTVRNAFSDSLFINLFCAHAVFEGSTEKE